MIDENKVMQILKSNGYVVVNFNSGWDATTHLSIADLNLCKGNLFFNSQLFEIIMRKSILNAVYIKMFESDYRERIDCVFSELPQVQHRTKQPAFVFAHIMLPHAPFVWGPNGEHLSRDEFFLQFGGQERTIEGYRDQLQFTNKKIQEVIDKILTESDRPTIIIIQSDHGSAAKYYTEKASEALIRERMNNINFIKLPDSEKGMLYDSMTPVNTFRIIFNSYFNGDYDLLEDKSYFSFAKQAPYRLLDVTDFLQQNKKIDLEYWN